MTRDGVYAIKNLGPKAQRVITSGLTWSVPGWDPPRFVELRADGTLHAARVAQSDDGNVVHGALELAGTWKDTPAWLELNWDARPSERLIRERHAIPPQPVFARGYQDERLGIVIDREGHWETTVQIDERAVVLTFPTGSPGEDDSAFARAGRIVAELDAGRLMNVVERLAEQVFPEYVEYMIDHGRPTMASPAELADLLQLDAIMLDHKGVATLRFARVLGEHSILGVLSADGTVELDHP
jgi:hypothetical protein